MVGAQCLLLKSLCISQYLVVYGNIWLISSDKIFRDMLLFEKCISALTGESSKLYSLVCIFHLSFYATIFFKLNDTCLKKVFSRQ